MVREICWINNIKIMKPFLLIVLAMAISSYSECIAGDIVQPKSVWERNIEATIGRSTIGIKSHSSDFIELIGYKYVEDMPDVSRYSKIIDKMFSSNKYLVLQSNGGERINL